MFGFTSFQSQSYNFVACYLFLTVWRAKEIQQNYVFFFHTMFLEHVDGFCNSIACTCWKKRAKHESWQQVPHTLAMEGGSGAAEQQGMTRHKIPHVGQNEWILNIILLIKNVFGVSGSFSFSLF